jgi:predicted ABC-type ATPase
MFIVAGPPGAGKSSFFGLRKFSDRVFNADDRAAELNGGSYQGISGSIRRAVNREFEIFVRERIAFGVSFALETTLRSTVTFEQARIARSLGFWVSMTYVGLENFDLHFERVKQRALFGGHAASESSLRRIHESSLRNLSAALDTSISGIDLIRVFNNSVLGEQPRVVLEVESRRVVMMADEFRGWLQTALGWSDSEVLAIQVSLRSGS